MHSAPRFLFGCLFVALLVVGFTLFAFQATVVTGRSAVRTHSMSLQTLPKCCVLECPGTP